MKSTDTKRREAAERQQRYNTYVNDVILHSDTATAQRFFLLLSPSQQRRVFADPAFGHLGWLVRLSGDHHNGR